ncbi:hypothetical protein APHAL10511_004468 [Amanita phalloides]|nr:hypothetical protein APHAL10511_004468 [Amanita phalloides]
MTNTIPISYLSALVNQLAKVGSQQQQHKSTKRGHPALQVFVRWVHDLRRRFTPLPIGTTHSVFRLLFPEEDARRKYGMQETLFCSHLAQCIGVSSDELHRWNTGGAHGCLGQELQKIILMRSSMMDNQNVESLLSVSDVDNLLDELASTSGYSDDTIRLKTPAPRDRQAILRHLYRSLSPSDASFVTQVILKDLRPLLYPLPSEHYTSALTNYNSTSVRRLTIEDAMQAWDLSGRLLQMYQLVPVIDDIANPFEQGTNILETMSDVGTFIQLPISKKGRGCSHALSYFRQSKRVWAETKYDGERAQIHIDILSNGRSKIAIFSKSKRNSTQDRAAIHDTIRRAVGISGGHQVKNDLRIKKNIILDAEMVACHGESIDEFWRIRELLANATSAMYDDGDRHLGLVFFDILVLDSCPLVRLPYSHRREILESVVKTAPGRVFLAKRALVDITTSQSERRLQAIFARSVANFEEGIVLKAEESLYHDFNLPWVKIKKDYIPGYGDTVDLIIMAAMWDKKRGRELRVPPSTYTTFFIGALDNTKENETTLRRPHLHVYFTVSYGLTREQLEDLNFCINSSGTATYKRLMDCLDYSFTLSPTLSVTPTIVFKRPLLAELVGAGFTKSANSKYYELRFPRITRVYRTSERTWGDGINLQELQEIALSCVGKDRPFKDVDDWCNYLWGKNASPSIRSRVKRKASLDAWEHRLAASHNECNGIVPVIEPLGFEHAAPSPAFPLAHAVEPRTQSLSMGHTHDGGVAESDFDQLFRGAVVWFPKETDQMLWKQFIPFDRCLHSLDSLLVGCGWRGIPPGMGSNPTKGIVMVQCHRWREFVMETLNTTDFRLGDNIESRIVFRREFVSTWTIMLTLSRIPHSFRFFSTLPNRAIVYTRNGSPDKVLSVIGYPAVPPPPPQTVNIRYLLSPVNPADINVVEGVYPTKPSVSCLTMSGEDGQEEPVFIGGNEGLAEVLKVGDGIAGLQEGDWVIPKKPQAGTWCTEMNVQAKDVLRLPNAQRLSDVQAATLMINPPTAYNLLHEFIHLESGDWVVQNGANSAVGQAVIQIAASKGFKTLNFVRNRANYKSLKDYLLKLGATRVMTYDELNDKGIRERIGALTSGKEIRLGLNCIGGQETTSMARLLAESSHLVSYGAMSKQPLRLPTSLFIFKNLKAHGFWQSRWYEERSQFEHEDLIQKLVQLITNDMLAPPAHDIVTISSHESLEEAGKRIRFIFSQLSAGFHGKKVLLKLESLH